MHWVKDVRLSMVCALWMAALCGCKSTSTPIDRKGKASSGEAQRSEI
jgi:hypothetical protein